MLRHLGQLLAAVLSLNALAASVSAAMTPDDVARAIAQAISRAEQIEPEAVIAVVDREGFVLGAWSVNGDTTSDEAQLKVLDAITKAGTAAFLSSDEHAFTSRTAGFIVQQNFPPGVRNRGTGPLVGVNFSNMSFTDVNRFKNPHSGYLPNGLSGVNGDPIVPLALSSLSGLAGSPGGVPLFRNHRLVGGIGVAGKTRAPRRSPFPMLADIQVQQTYDPDEDVALAGQIGFQPEEILFGSHVFIDGIRVPYVKGKTRLGQVKPLGTVGAVFFPYEITESPVVEYPTDIFGGQSCEIRAPIIADPLFNPMSDDARNAARLTADDVTRILSQASARAKITRAGIRLPRGRAAQTFITVVNNPNQPDVAPTILGTIRTPDATIFSWDVAIQKARTAIFFSSDARAFSARTVGFLAQRFFPPGIVNTAHGPFYGMQERFSLLPPKSLGATNILNGVALEDGEALTSPNPSLPNGITIFPGGFPLYRNGLLIGAIGVSGDGIDQDDIISAAGTVGFLPPPDIRADHMQYRGARLPYAKFPRNPDL